MSTGAVVSIENSALNIFEDDEFRVCVKLSNNTEILERNVPVKLAIDLQSQCYTSGSMTMCLYGMYLTCRYERYSGYLCNMLRIQTWH